MNKLQLIDAIAGESGLTKADSKRAVDAFVSAVSKSLHQGEKVIIPGFGTFKISQRTARIGRNPSTGAKLNIPAKKVVRFKAGSELAQKVK